MRSVRALVGAALAALLGAPAAAVQEVIAEHVAGGFARPVVLAATRSEPRALFVGEQHTGHIYRLDLRRREIAREPLARGGEQGLLGLAFHPRFARNGYFYVNFTRAGDGATVIRRYRAGRRRPARAAFESLDLLVIPQPQANHNGGWIGFGPADGYLYVATGDGGAAYDGGFGHTEPGGNAQDLTDNLLGKLLRIDVDGDDFPEDPARNYAIPPDNPFVGIEGDDEIWAYGLRNPFRCSFDAGTDDLYCGDVGQGAREEIDYQPGGSTGGENYGWRLREGSIATPFVGGPRPAGAVDPIFDYGRAQGQAVTGGVVYRGPTAALRGLYFFCDFAAARIWSLRHDGFEVVEFNDWSAEPGFLPPTGQVAQISTFGADRRGNVYFASLLGDLFAIGIDCNGDGRIDRRNRCPRGRRR